MKIGLDQTTAWPLAIFLAIGIYTAGYFITRWVSDRGPGVSVGEEVIEAPQPPSLPASEEVPAEEVFARPEEETP